MTTDQMFPETTEERITRVRKVFEGAVDKAAGAVSKAEEKLHIAEAALAEFDEAIAAKDQELELIDRRLRRALEIKGIDPNTGECE
jgi:hypothetical protein